MLIASDVSHSKDTMSMCPNRQNSEKGGPALTECDSIEDAERSSFHKRKALM